MFESLLRYDVRQLQLLRQIMIRLFAMSFRRTMRLRMIEALTVMVVVLVAGCAGTSSDRDELRLTVMSFNVWGAGSNDGHSIADTVAVIRYINPHVIGLQETRAEGDNCTEAVCPPLGESFGLLHV